MSKRQRYIESLPLFPDHVAEYMVKGGNGMTPEMTENLKYNLKQDALNEKIEEVIGKCVEAARLTMDENFIHDIDYAELEAMVRSSLLTAANLWGL